MSGQTSGQPALKRLNIMSQIPKPMKKTTPHMRIKPLAITSSPWSLNPWSCQTPEKTYNILLTPLAKPYSWVSQPRKTVDTPIVTLNIPYASPPFNSVYNTPLGDYAHRTLWNLNSQGCLCTGRAACLKSGQLEVTAGAVILRMFRV